MRYVALVQPTDIHPTTRHYRGMPPDLSARDAPMEEMPWPRILVIRPSGRGFFLDRLTEDGDSAGDTWHQDVEEAREQAADEYNGSLGPWRPVPDAISDSDVIAYALNAQTPG